MSSLLAIPGRVARLALVTFLYTGTEQVILHRTTIIKHLQYKLCKLSPIQSTLHMWPHLSPVSRLQDRYSFHSQSEILELRKLKYCAQD